jgi:hypothetical protein
MSKPESKITPEDIAKILEAIGKAYEVKGKKIKTAVLIEDDESKILIDNREDKDLN